MDIVYLADHREIIPTIAQWFYGEWAYLYSDRTFADVEPLIGGRANAPVALVVFEAQGLFGTVCLKVHDTDTRSDLTVWLADFYASAAWRRKSNRITLLLGPSQSTETTLVSAIEQQAHDLGVEKLYLYTPESDTFYAKRGWHVKERIICHSCPVTLMQKEIVL